MIDEILEEQDYDAGLLNDHGGGEVEWWQNYIRDEISRCNEYWRSTIESYGPNKLVEPTDPVEDQLK